MDLIKLFYTAVLFLGSTSLTLANENYTNKEIVYLEFQDYEYNVTRVIDSLQAPDFSVLRKSTAASNQYLLYTRNNSYIPQHLIVNNASSIRSSYFNTNAQTVVLVHGWFGNQDSQLNTAVRNAYLGVMDANVIVLDWSGLSNSDYITATWGVPGVGRALGQFLAFLNIEFGASFSNMHLVGFSLGAHVVGNAGDYVGGKVARITGLDPAGPLWGLLNLNRLAKSNAVYVEAIHTNRGVLGTIFKSGDVDFYPNGGSSQPGCTTSSCNHNRSWQLFAATITYDHLVGRKCSGDNTLALGFCNGDYLPMGNRYLKKTGSGMYRLKTYSDYPYR